MKGKEKAIVVDDDENWDYDMSYVSGLINASEYRDMEVRSYVGVGVVDPKSRVGIETFLETMDFRLVPLPPFRPKEFSSRPDAHTAMPALDLPFTSLPHSYLFT